MKNVIFILIFFSVFSVTGQELDSIYRSPQELHDFYTKKKNTNKIVGWSMIGAGIVMIVSSLAINLSDGIVDNDSTNNKKGIWLSYVGGATTLASIPFFISAGNNKRKAKLELKKDVVQLNSGTSNSTNVSLTIDF